ncbi:uncharacterized protein SAPINGB_P000322 [Magnusiomyces paraingens]|uniref:Extracellular membrane protein CFEM domain-containing protein n=1 Tax=Magnusiomyces paraingens TaxID=2606893 RepID=A0A5E8B4A2_9ASCO|nr:uncharacterized protein SAPINGB_P000322 [Saprochaete ingens]VVT44155.1 unnamed protein product [Saprochaete ingens]
MIASQALLSLFVALAAAAPEALPSPYAAALAAAAAGAAPQDGASYSCHSYCGNAILQGRECGTDDTDCLCSSDSEFMKLIPDCLDCGSTLWSSYGKYLVPYLEACNLQTTPNPLPASSTTEGTGGNATVAGTVTATGYNTTATSHAITSTGSAATSASATATGSSLSRSVSADASDSIVSGSASHTAGVSGSSAAASGSASSSVAAGDASTLGISGVLAAVVAAAAFL